jgi:hypothetical protein
MNNRTFCAEIAHNVSSRVLNYIYFRKEPKLSKELNKLESKSLIQEEKLEHNKKKLKHDFYLKINY